MKAKISALTVISDDLQQIIADCEVEQEKRLRELEALYKGHFEEISDISKRLRVENGELKKRWLDGEAKASSFGQENSFLRRENDMMRQDLDKLKRNLEKKDREVSELKVEVTAQQLENQKISQSSNAK
ncbi:unnamed protein product, partial [Mesorhabditis spiculigera]